MTDTFSTEERSAIMRAVKSKDTRPEMMVRAMLHRAGFRFRLHRKDLPGSPDLVFPARRKAVFVHGCFWHGHSDPHCKRARIPKTRPEYWRGKLSANVERDHRAREALAELGWSSLTIWECELRDPDRVLRRACDFLNTR